MALSTRQRRPQPSDPSSSSSSPASPSYSKVDKQGKSGGVEQEKVFSWFVPLLALGMLRYMSATSNIIHDCDEVFNYWEPLHYLLYKSGFQTWEYRWLFFLWIWICSSGYCKKFMWVWISLFWGLIGYWAMENVVFVCYLVKLWWDISCYRFLDMFCFLWISQYKGL